MWIKRSEFVAMVRELEMERRRADRAIDERNAIQVQLESISKRNLELQDMVASLGSRGPVTPFEFNDPLDEDPEDVARVLAEIKQHGRDVILMREARNE